MLSNESKFWSDLMLASHPGWSVVVAHDWNSMPVKTSLYKVNIYAYDMATGWAGACMTTEEDLTDGQKAMAGSEKKRVAIRNAAQVELMALADAMASGSSESTRRGLVLAMYYIAQTQTVETVRRQFGNVEGHWLCLIHRFKSGTSTMRPVYMSHVASKTLFSPAMVAQWASEASDADLLRDESELSRLLRRGEVPIIA